MLNQFFLFQTQRILGHIYHFPHCGSDIMDIGSNVCICSTSNVSCFVYGKLGEREHVLLSNRDYSGSKTVVLK